MLSTIQKLTPRPLGGPGPSGVGITPKAHPSQPAGTVNVMRYRSRRRAYVPGTMVVPSTSGGVSVLGDGVGASLARVQPEANTTSNQTGASHDRPLISISPASPRAAV